MSTQKPISTRVNEQEWETFKDTVTARGHSLSSVMNELIRWYNSQYASQPIMSLPLIPVTTVSDTVSISSPEN